MGCQATSQFDQENSQAEHECTAQATRAMKMTVGMEETTVMMVMRRGGAARESRVAGARRGGMRMCHS
ncbi:MAG: hypothetical protein NVSMB65_06300 [Chloroflexota bacterium]